MSDSEGSECYFVGGHPETQRDDQTHGDWKKEIEDILTDKLKDVDMEIDWHEGTIYG